jgi:hypothetical protein
MMVTDELAESVLLAFPTVRDQGPRGTCAAFATTAVHEHRCASPRALSEEHAFWLGRQVADPATSGVAVADVLRGLHRDGQLFGDDWPYGQPPPSDFTAGDLCDMCPLPEWEQLADCRFSTVRRVLDAGSPVVLSVAFASEVWFGAAATGWLDHDSAASVTGGHAVLGIAASDDGSTPAVLVRNSWGPAWGLAGYAWAPAALLDAHGLVAHSVGMRRAA